ncbi:hypothetical protein D9O50_04500 [Oxalobacteraceae bacterium CAVE-383]|nr:hypothetical protein D9O50_04500 [Oxalobacteraceae bacterium CAVE-383]
MTTSNFSLVDIMAVYKTMIASASENMSKAKDNISEKATPQETLDFDAAVKTWELMNTTAFSALSSVADSLKEGLRQR